MVSSINTSGITVGTDGKVQVSGFASSIDWKSIVDATITARRVPAVKLEAKITQNNSTIAAFGELKTTTASLTTALDKLRGSNSFLSDNVFKTKSASGSTAAASGAPASHVPSDISSLLSVNVQSTAQVTNHTITIQQLAKAHQVRSDAFTSTSSALTGLGVTAGDIEINGQTVTIDADDTLLDLRSKINSSGAGVTATIVSASANVNYLVVTADDTGTANEISFGAGTVTSDDVGFTDTGAIKNELVAAQDAIIDVDGITGITRSSNDIDDVIEGVTLSLLKAEVNTDISLNIEPDLVTIKSAVVDFMTAYNDLRTFYETQRTAADRNEDGTVDSNELGPLAYDNTLRSIIDKLGQMSAGEVANNTDGYRSLSQIGIVVGSDFKLDLDESIFDSKLITDVDSMRTLFGFEFTSSDSRLSYLDRTDNTQAGTYYVNIAGVDGGGAITSANIQDAAVVGNGGADDGTLTVAGLQATGTSDANGANGLNLFFNAPAGTGGVDDIELTISRGIADSFFDYFEELTRISGTFDTRIAELNQSNVDYQEDIDTIDTRLETVRTTLELKFVRMETALAQLESLRDSLTSYFDAQNSDS